MKEMNFKQLRRKISRIIVRYQAVFYALGAFFLFLALQQQVKTVIGACLLPVFDIRYHWAYDVFFLLAALALLIEIARDIRKKSVSLNGCVFTYWLVAVYLYYRFFDETYRFVGFFDGGIAYLDLLACFLIFRSIFSFGKQEWKYWKKQPEDVDEKLYKRDKKIKDYKQDKFNLKKYVDNILHFLDNMDVSEKACSIGLVGKWGHGKSSIFELMKLSVDARKENSSEGESSLGKQPEYIVVEFNPRSSKSIERIQEDFFNALKGALNVYHLNLTKIFEDYADALDISTNASPVVAFLIRILQIHRKDRQESFETINEVIRLTGKRVLVLVDDLDRLTGKELLEVMKVIEKNGAFANIIFVSAYDKEYVNNAINSYLQHKSPYCYTDKYFETEIHVPSHAYFLLRKYMYDLFLEASKIELIKPNETELNKIMTNCDAYLEKRIHNLRDAKRFHNQLLFHYRNVKDGVVFRDYLLLQLMRYVHPDEYARLCQYAYVEMENGGSVSAVASRELLYLKPEYASKTGTQVGQLPASVDILRALFPTKETYTNGWYENRYQRIFSVSSFDVYFYNYEYGHLSQSDIDTLYTASLEDACKQIKKWSEKHKDLGDYLLTRKARHLGTKEKLKRYCQILLCAYYQYGGLNYSITAKSFFSKEFVKESVSICGYADRNDYLIWIEQTLSELLTINAYILTEYLQSMIVNLQEDASLSEVYEYEVHELQKMAVSFLKIYLERIEQERWNAEEAFALSQVRGDRVGETYAPAAQALRESMDCYPKKYIAALMPFAVQIPRTKTNPERVKISFTERFIVKEIYSDIQDFEKWLYNPCLNNEEHIDLIRRFWNIYSVNDCHPLVVDGHKPETIEDLEKMVNSVLQFES